MEDLSIQLRALNEIVYCEKLFYLMYHDGIFADNADTLTGTMQHKKRENNSRNNSLEGANVYSFVLYAMDGILSGKLDGVVFENNEFIPIEDKNSKQPEGGFSCDLWGIKVKTDVWINDFPQIVGQMYLLRKNGYVCNRGRIYYRGSNRIIEIDYEDKYDELIENGVKHCIQLLSGTTPKCLTDSDKCVNCSLNWACLPDETNYLNKETNDNRRLYPGRPDSSILYITIPGTKVGKSGESLTIVNSSGDKNTVPIKDVENVCIFGNSQITTQALCEITASGGGVFFFSQGGWLNAISSAPITKNINLRIVQFAAFNDERLCTVLVKEIVKSKILNQRTLIRRNSKENISEILSDLKNYQIAMIDSNEIDSIRGYEGLAAKKYWDAYAKLFNELIVWKMDGRNRRPPKDEINALLSYGYSLLLRDFISAIMQTGMDYLLGFYHSVQSGRPALALDMMEPYRPIIVDSVVLRLIKERMIKKEDFVTTEEGIYMKPTAKHALIYMYEKRLDEMITHPIFGYRLSYRRMICLEAKLLGKFLTGEIEKYEPLTTR